MYDHLQWRPFSVPPTEGQIIFVRTDDGGVRTTPFKKCLLDYNTEFYGLVWMDASDVLDAPMGYDPKFGDGRMCLCGHPYYRHFDPSEDWSPVGCKYCHAYEEGVEYRKEVEVHPPADLCDPNNFDSFNSEAYNKWWEGSAPPPSICSGFKEDTTATPEPCPWENSNAG